MLLKAKRSKSKCTLDRTESPCPIAPLSLEFLLIWITSVPLSHKIKLPILFPTRSESKTCRKKIFRTRFWSVSNLCHMSFYSN